MNLFSQLKKMKLLLIDDDEWIRDSLSLFFEGEGCHLLALETAEEAIKALKHYTYDIIITNYELPGMDGLELVRYIQAKNFNSLIMFITAYGNDEMVSEAKRLGVISVIQKPLTGDTIEKTLSMSMQSQTISKTKQGAEDVGQKLDEQKGSKRRY